MVKLESVYSDRNKTQPLLPIEACFFQFFGIIISLHIKVLIFWWKYSFYILLVNYSSCKKSCAQLDSRSKITACPLLLVNRKYVYKISYLMNVDKLVQPPLLQKYNVWEEAILCREKNTTTFYQQNWNHLDPTKLKQHHSRNGYWDLTRTQSRFMTCSHYVLRQIVSYCMTPVKC